MGLSLLRHTRPAIGRGICYGRLDVDVAESFEEEAAALFESLPSFERLISSPLQRSAKLADYIGAARGIVVERDARLTEMDFGDWEGQSWDDISRDELDVWAGNFMHARPHGGESVAMLHARVTLALSKLRAKGQSCLVVTHAGVIKAAMASGDRATDWPKSLNYGEYILI